MLRTRLQALPLQAQIHYAHHIPALQEAQLLQGLQPTLPVRPSHPSRSSSSRVSALLPCAHHSLYPGLISEDNRRSEREFLSSPLRTWRARQSTSTCMTLQTTTHTSTGAGQEFTTQVRGRGQRHRHTHTPGARCPVSLAVKLDSSLLAGVLRSAGVEVYNTEYAYGGAHGGLRSASVCHVLLMSLRLTLRSLLRALLCRARV